MPDYLILISTLGGMELYGINGFVIGPLIAALFIACWNLFSGRDHEGNAEELDADFIEEGKILQICKDVTIKTTPGGAVPPFFALNQTFSII
jgi:hypothetical protein